MGVGLESRDLGVRTRERRASTQGASGSSNRKFDIPVGSQDLGFRNPQMVHSSQEIVLRNGSWHSEERTQRNRELGQKSLELGLAWSWNSGAGS